MNWPQGESPSISNLQVYLTDFGMVDRAGGTPVYCSPEGLTGAAPGISDTFSLGRVFTFLVMENRCLFYTLVFYTIADSTFLRCIRNILASFPIFNLIREMTHFDKNKRISIDQVEQRLVNMNIKIIQKSNILSKLRTQRKFKLLRELANAGINDFQVNTMLNERWVIVSSHNSWIRAIF